jgi:hypothetical protein
MIDAGMSLEQVLDAAPTSDYDGLYTDAAAGVTGERFVEAVYRDLSGAGE